MTVSPDQRIEAALILADLMCSLERIALAFRPTPVVVARIERFADEDTAEAIDRHQLRDLGRKRAGE
jgi:hypothetical protein